MKMTSNRGRILDTFVAALAAALLVAPAHAGEHAYPISSALYKSECGSCHVAYPPQLLGASSWKDIMDGLAKHFGSDASLDAKTSREIAAYLEANAGRGKRARGESLRITDASWFRHEHGEELSPAVWKNPKIKSAANCEACHTQAGQGDYSERSLRVPR